MTSGIRRRFWKIVCQPPHQIDLRSIVDDRVQISDIDRANPTKAIPSGQLDRVARVAISQRHGLVLVAFASDGMNGLAVTKIDDRDQMMKKRSVVHDAGGNVKSDSIFRIA